ncbi:MAG TPA: MBL fold metallo-hydrolase [Alphaproteobacteria bacterium]|jgi:glyoxylase-like metal-dependent hydrolase (beta-lactamase superfamily II)
MIHFLRRYSYVCALLAVATAGSFAVPAAAQDKMEMRTVADGVYMMENTRGSGNSSFVITDDGVLVFDADLRTADQVLAQIRKLTDKKVKYLVISHSAGDHASGAWLYREDKPVFIATKTQMRDLYMQESKEFEERKKTDEAYKGKELTRPDIGFEGGLTLQFGGLTFVLTEEGVSHSTSDVTVFIPQKRVFLTGDLLDTEIHPGQGESAGVFFSNVKGWLKNLDNIMARNLPVDTYVPGHGPVHVGRGVADIQEQKAYFIAMRNEVSKMMAAGKSLAQIEKEIEVPKEFAHYQRKPRLVSFVKLYYNQLIEQGY